MAKKHQRREKANGGSVLAGEALLVEKDAPSSIPEWGEAFLSDPNRYRLYDLFEESLESWEGFSTLSSELPPLHVSIESCFDKLYRYTGYRIPYTEETKKEIESWFQEIETLHPTLKDIVTESLCLTFDERQSKKAIITLFSKHPEKETERELALNPLKEVLSEMNEEDRERFFEILDSKIVPLMLDSFAQRCRPMAWMTTYEDGNLFALPVSYLLLEDEKLRKQAGAFFPSFIFFSDALYFLSGERYYSSVWRTHAMKWDGEGSLYFLRDQEKEETLRRDFSMRFPVSHVASSFLVDELCAFLGFPTPGKVAVKVEEARQRIKNYSEFLLGWLEKTEEGMVREGMRGFWDLAQVSLPNGIWNRFPFGLGASITKRFHDLEARRVCLISDLVNRMSQTCLPYLLPPEEMARFLKALGEEGRKMMGAGASLPSPLPSCSDESWKAIHDERTSDCPPIGIHNPWSFKLSLRYRDQIVNSAWESMLRNKFPHFMDSGEREGDPSLSPPLRTDFPRYFTYYPPDEDSPHTEAGASYHPEEYHTRHHIEGEAFLAAAFSYALGWHEAWSPKLAQRGEGPTVEVPNLAHWLGATSEVRRGTSPTVTLGYRAYKAENLLAFKDFYGSAFLSPEIGWRWSNLLWVSEACGGVTPEEMKKLHRGVKNGYFIPVCPIDVFVTRALGMSDDVDWEDWDLLNLLCFFSGFSGSEVLRRELHRWVEENGSPNVHNVVAANLQMHKKDRERLREALAERSRREKRGEQVPSKKKTMSDFLRENGYVKRIEERRAIDFPRWEEEMQELEAQIRLAKSRHSRFLIEARETSVALILQKHLLFRSPSSWCPHLMGDCSTISLRNPFYGDPMFDFFHYPPHGSLPKKETIEVFNPAEYAATEKRATISLPSVSRPTDIFNHLRSPKCWWERHGVMHRSTSLYKEISLLEENGGAKSIVDLFSL